MNNYRQNLYERIEEYGFPDVPILNGEFAWTHDASMFIREPFEPNIGYTPNDRMLRNGMSNLLRASSHPNLVGWTWYRWVSNKRGRREDGVVGVHNNEIEINTSVHARINARTLVYRAASDAGAINTPQLSDGDYVVILNDALFVNDKVQESLVFGFRIKEGQPFKHIEGFSCDGKVVAITTDKDELIIKVGINLVPSRFSKEQGSAEYTIRLNQQKFGHSKGTFSGTNKNHAMKGSASIWSMASYRNP